MYKTTLIEDLKTDMIEGMKTNFKNDGGLIPVLFFLNNEELKISAIPQELLQTTEGKISLGDTIKDICAIPTVVAAGIIVEANLLKIKTDDTATIETVMDKDNSIADMENTEDSIIMILSTPEKEELIGYFVDVENKKILDEINFDMHETIEGIFANFFQWSKN